MDKKKTTQEDFVKEMTGKSLNQFELDKCLKQTIDGIVKKIPNKNLVGIVAIGDFHDIDNPVVSFGGFFPPAPHRYEISRAFFLMKCVESFIRDCDDDALDILKLFIHDCKAMLEYYEKHIKDFEQEQATKED